MITTQPHPQQVCLDRLDFGRLRQLLADLDIQAGYYMPGESEIKGFEADIPLDPPLLQLACEAQHASEVLCREEQHGAAALAVRMDASDDSSPVAVGRIRAGDAAWLAKTFGCIVQDWYARGCEQAREVEALSHSLAETYEELSATYRLSEAMNLTASCHTYLEGLAEELRDLLAAEAVVISLTRQTVPTQTGNVATIVSGRLTMPAERIVACVDVPNLVKRGYQVVAIGFDGMPASNGQAAAQVLSTPIVRSGQCLGVITALRTGTACQVNNIDVTRISSIARNAAVVLENFNLYDNLRHLFLGTVRALTQSIDAKDPYTCGHSERVAALSRRLVLQLGGTAQQADRMYLCGLLHDIGKIGVPESVLGKAGRLTAEEFDTIKRHPVVGGDILDGISELEDVVPGVIHHHERVDGRGYPKGLIGEQIPLYARVLAVADTFDAMTSARPYRQALSVQVAVEELRRHAGAQFDPAVVEAMLQLGPDTIFQELSLIQTGHRLSGAEEAAGSGRQAP